MDLTIIILTIVGGTCTLGAGLCKIVNDRRVAEAKVEADKIAKANEAERREAEARRVEAVAKQSNAFQLGMIQLVAARAKVDTMAAEAAQLMETLRLEAAKKDTPPTIKPAMERLSQTKLDMKAFDSDFDKILEGVAPAVAKAIVSREEERKRHAEVMIQHEKNRQAAEISRRHVLDNMNNNSLLIFTRAREVIVESVNHFHNTRLGRKVEVDLMPFPDGLMVGNPQVYTRIEAGSIKFDNGTAWKFFIIPGSYVDGRATQPRLSVEDANERRPMSMALFQYDYARPTMPPFGGQGTLIVRVESHVLPPVPGIEAAKRSYLAEKITADDLFAKITLALLGEKEIKDTLRKTETAP